MVAVDVLKSKDFKLVKAICGKTKREVEKLLIAYGKKKAAPKKDIVKVVAPVQQRNDKLAAKKELKLKPLALPPGSARCQWSTNGVPAPPPAAPGKPEKTEQPAPSYSWKLLF
ncbi:MAG: hypothetical protein D6719_06225 [Candidatus Dadabacteria bacterium]|nr:MAG: hypothetical protein D6719_06225 [Candidatus Dadabacteria bacterium]